MEMETVIFARVLQHEGERGNRGYVHWSSRGACGGRRASAFAWPKRVECFLVMFVMR